ncbi:MAG: glycosyltransferase family 1 protein, partial [Patescibacteria group bacterium]
NDSSEFTAPNITVNTFPFSQYNKFLPFAYSHLLITASLMRANLDVFHSPVTSLPLTYPRKSIVTVHDLAIYKNPAWFPSQIFSTKLLVPRTLNTADHLIAVSKSTRRDLRDLFNVPDKKISVIYEGATVAKIPVKSASIDSLKQFKLGSRYLLFVGTLAPRKNIIILLRAYRKMITTDPGLASYQLVLAGARDYRSDEVLEEIKTLKLSRQVRYIGYVTHNQKIELLKKAACFAFPSSYEGFGLPVVEAMALGTPVVTSNVSSLPEVAGDAALQVDPERVDDLAAALRSVLRDRRVQSRLRRAGPLQAQRFTWERCATETVKTYERFKP